MLLHRPEPGLVAFGLTACSQQGTVCSSNRDTISLRAMFSRMAPYTEATSDGSIHHPVATQASPSHQQHAIASRCEPIWIALRCDPGGEVEKRGEISSIHRDAVVWFVALLRGRSPLSRTSLPMPPLPEEVVRVAHAVFPQGNVFLQVRDALGTIYTDEAFADRFPTPGQPAFAPWRLALVTIFQFLEGLTDRQAADAVRDRRAWTYALSLELTDSGCDQTVRSKFRARLVEGKAEQRLLDLLVGRCREGGWLKAHGRQRTDSTPILANIRSLSRTLRVAQTMVYVLHVLSEVAPDGIRTPVPIEWVERYGQRLEEERLPKEEQERTPYANQVGADGWMLLDALQAPGVPDWMKTLPAVTTLCTRGEQPLEAREQGGQWRKEPVLPAAQLIASP